MNVSALLWFAGYAACAGHILGMKSQDSKSILSRNRQLDIRKRIAALSNGFREFQLFETEQSVAQRFEEQARRYGGRLAVKSQNVSYTYDELNRAANRVMHAMPALGSKAPVALLLKHDAALIASILGTLKAGRVYCALDPFFPEERNRQILEELQPGAILCDHANLEYARRMKAQDHALVCVDEVLCRDDLPRPGNALSVKSNPGDFASIVFTSGSTGRPKGVVQTHRNLLNVVRRYTNSLYIGPEDRLSLLASCSVTASVGNLFAALLNGASIFPFDVKEHGFTRLRDWLREEAVTVYHSVPTLFRHLLRDLPPETVFPAVRLVRFGGDLAYASDFELFRKFFAPGCVLVNGYGCSEISSVWHYYLDSETEVSGNVLPIGYPIAGITGYLRDEQGRRLALAPGEGALAGPDTVGEIVIESDYLSPGYWGRHGLSGVAAESSGKRVYETGDLGYLSPEGALVHAGRKDSQVKIRGFRIELAEIEAVLREYPGVREAAAVIQERSSDEKQLAAFVVLENGLPEMIDNLRQHLQARLPGYMVPATLARVDELPFTRNGKLDRGRLASMAALYSAAPSEIEAPQNNLERGLAEIWGQALNLKEVGVTQNFFAIGGNSISAVKIVMLLRERLRLHVPLRLLFDKNNIRELAAALESCAAIEGSGGGPVAQFALLQGPVAFLPYISDSGAVPASMAQRGLWYLNEMAPQSSAFNMHRWTSVEGELNRDLWKQSFQAVLARHDSLRTSFAMQGNTLVQRISPEPCVPMDFVDLEPMPAEERMAEAERRAFEQAHAPFDLSRAPLVRALLLRLSEDKHIFSVTMHHAISDAWSLDVFLRDLYAFYREKKNGIKTDLPETPVQYGQFSEWQRNWLNSAEFEQQLGYWKRQLRGHPFELSLFTDYPRPAIQAFKGARLNISIPDEVSDGIKAIAKRENVTVFMALMAAFYVLLMKYTGEEDLLAGSPVAGRKFPGTEDTIGLFVNLLPFRIDLSGDPTFTGLLTRTRDVVVNAFENQDVPFERLIESLQPARDPSRMPLVQIVFIVNGPSVEKTLIPGLLTRRLELKKDTAKYDMVWMMNEQGENFEVKVEYNTDLFEAETVKNMAQSFATLLRGITAQPDEHISALPMLSESEQYGIIAEYNQN